MAEADGRVSILNVFNRPTSDAGSLGATPFWACNLTLRRVLSESRATRPKLLGEILAGNDPSSDVRIGDDPLLATPDPSQNAASGLKTNPGAKG
jgi:hypothetical protein